MIYRVTLSKVEHPKGEPFKKTELKKVFLTDLTLNGSIDDLGKVARHRSGLSQATHFSAEGMQSVPEHYYDIPLSWQPKPGKWELVCCGTID